MPGDDRLWFDDEQCRPPIVLQLREPNPEDAVSPTEAPSVATAGTLQDQELMAEGENLDLQNEASSEPISQAGE
jgi:hypothetical protein